MMVYPRSSQDALDPKRRLGSYQPRPCARPDDIATYLFLDEALVARLQRNQPASWDFSDRSKWILQVRGFVDDIVNASGVRSTQRLFLFAATVTSCSLWPRSPGIGRPRSGSWNRLMMPMSGARSPRFRPRSRVLSRRSRSQTTNPLKLEDRDYRAQLARAEASVAAQRSALAKIDANRRMHKAVIEQASAAVGGAAAELARAKYDFDRYRTLSTDQFASRQRFEQADADHEKARAAERRARAALDAAERQLDVIATQKQQTQAALDQALAERDLALLNLAYTEVRSPIDGVVGNRSARRRLCHGRSPAPRNRPRARPLG